MLCHKQIICQLVASGLAEGKSRSGLQVNEPLGEIAEWFPGGTEGEETKRAVGLKWRDNILLPPGRLQSMCGKSLNSVVGKSFVE